MFLGLLRGTFVTGEPPADTTDRPTLGPATGNPGWTALDDAIADIIADVARTELTALTRALDAQSHRKAHHTAANPADPVAEAGARVNRSPISRSLTATDARDPGTLIANAEASDARPLTFANDELTERHHHIGALITGARVNRFLTTTTPAEADRDPRILIVQAEALTSELLTTADDALPSRHTATSGR
ncbi:hypothetical protein [Actinoallomurus iriomotensis]|uniref:Uncharacterized protein n=1 Tax=Actinoallomurus iriomotensis TaxID=478107 RepID=A0A9W6VVK2_9ACTN|nr:hypothetical protein [Actinoallomurus iriomotensis]GLY79821.1 hypothetical protein Airi01_080880 [Actinoallomurus iriomotensis]